MAPWWEQLCVAGLWGGTSMVRFERSQTDVIAQAVAADRSGDAVVVACPDQLGVALQRQVERLVGDDVDVVPYPTAGDPRFVDWVDYGERNAAADPAAFVEQLRGRLGGGTTVYVVANFTYRTFEGQCEEVLGLLSSGRQVDVLVERDDDRHDEVANLWAIRPG